MGLNNKGDLVSGQRIAELGDLREEKNEVLFVTIEGKYRGYGFCS